MKEISLRHAEPSDYQPIITNIDAWWGGRKMADMLPKLFFVHFRPTCFVAENAGGVVGIVIGFRSQTFADLAYIHFVGIHPDFRKNGLGKLLYERFFSTVVELGCCRVQCVTSPVNKGSIAFHQNMGFTPESSDHLIDGIPVIEGYDGKDEGRVLFSKDLAQRADDQ